MGILKGIVSFGRKMAVEHGPKVFKGLKGLASKGFGWVGKNVAEIGGNALKQVLTKGVKIAGVWGGLNVALAQGEGLDKLKNGLSNMGAQAAFLASAGQTAAQTGASAVEATSEYVEAYNQDGLGGLFSMLGDGSKNMIQGFIEKIPENLRGWIMPVAVLGGALAFSNGGIIGKVATVGMAIMAGMSLMSAPKASDPDVVRSLEAGAEDTAASERKALPSTSEPEQTAPIISDQQLVVG